MSLTPPNEQNSLLIAGYIRAKEIQFALQHSIPTGIQQIILKYFLFNEFKFENACDCFAISDDKLTMKLKDRRYGTIQFGPFLKSSDKFIYKVKFELIEIYKNHFGFGFITPEFDKWDHGRSFNRCEKACVNVYCGTFYEASPEFQAINEQYINKKSITGGQMRDEINVEDRDHVEIVMNMFENKGIISFYCKDKLNDNIEDSPSFSAEINLLDEVAIILDGGYYEQSVTVIDQRFEYGQ